MTKATLILVFNDQLEAAMAFYTATFTDSKIRNVARNGMEWNGGHDDDGEAGRRGP